MEDPQDKPAKPIKAAMLLGSGAEVIFEEVVTTNRAYMSWADWAQGASPSKLEAPVLGVASVVIAM